MKTVLPLLAVICVFISFKSHADASVNAAITSNYVWRGETYTDDGPALQGGADWWNEQGLYTGVWLSNTDDGTDTDLEYDLYLGYELGLDPASIDLGIIYYELLDTEDADITEIYAGILLADVSAYYYIDSDNDTTYVSAAYDISFDDYGLNLFAGSWGDTAEGNNFGATLSREYAELEFSLTVEHSDEDLEDDTLVYVMVSRSWDL